MGLIPTSGIVEILIENVHVVTTISIGDNLCFPA